MIHIMTNIAIVAIIVTIQFGALKKYEQEKDKKYSRLIVFCYLALIIMAIF